MTSHGATFGARTYVAPKTYSYKPKWSFSFGYYGGYSRFGISYGYYPYYKYKRYYPYYYYSYCPSPYWYVPAVVLTYPIYRSYYYPSTVTYCDSYTYQRPVREVHHYYHLSSDNDSYERKDDDAVKVVKEEGEEEENVGSPGEQLERLGDLFFRAGKYDQAAVAYRRAVKESPDRHALHLVLADALFAEGDYGAAAASIRTGIQKDPLMVLAGIDKRDFYAQEGDFEKHFQALETYLESSPYDANALLVLGYNLHFTGKVGEARKAFASVKKLNPEDPVVDFFLVAQATGEKAVPPAKDD